MGQFSAEDGTAVRSSKISGAIVMSTTPSDPMEFLKSLWGTAGVPLPGLVTPTLDTDELEKRIADLKAVEGWLKTNLGMLQMTIQGLEVQRATIAAMQAITQSGSGTEGSTNPFANPALWPWNLMKGDSDPAPEPASSPAAADEKPPKFRKTK